MREQNETLQTNWIQVRKAEVCSRVLSAEANELKLKITEMVCEWKREKERERKTRKTKTYQDKRTSPN